MKEFDFDQIWPELEPLVRCVHAALVDGIHNADRLDQILTELVNDPILWAQHVRAYVAQVLEVPSNGTEGFVIARGFNISITMHSDKASLRILKAGFDEMPQPGNSIGRANYLNQNLGQLELFQADLPQRSDLPEYAPNFVLKWTIDEHHKLCQLDLGYPKPTAREIGEVIPQEWYWIEPVMEQTKPIYGADRPTSDYQDLDIERNDDEEEGDEGTGTV